MTNWDDWAGADAEGPRTPPQDDDGVAAPDLP